MSRRVAWSLGLAFAIASSVAKLRQHARFETNAYDLGLYANVAWNTAHGRWFRDSVQDLNHLGDHFSPFFLILAPLYRLYDQPQALLVLQSLAIGLAAVILYRLAAGPDSSTARPLAITLLFLTCPYLHKINVFDFHPTVLAIPLFFGMLHALEAGNPVLFLSLAILAATVQETLLPPLVGLGFYAFLFTRRLRSLGLAVAVAAGLFFAFEVLVAMPFFLGENRLTHIPRYANLGGESLGEIAWSLLQDPFLLARELVTPVGKLQSLGWLLLWVGFLPLLAPSRLALVVIPLLVLLSSGYEGEWSLRFQYTATVLPFLFYATIGGFSRLEDLLRQIRPRWRRAPLAAVPALLCAALVGFALRELWMGHPSYFPKKVSESYRSSLRDLLAMVPPRASVCASQNLVPHLTDRPEVTQFGRDGLANLDLRDAEYVVLEDPSANAFHLSREEYASASDDLLHSPRYRLIEENEGGRLFVRTEATGTEPD